jgi:hypothetical protein
MARMPWPEGLFALLSVGSGLDGSWPAFGCRKDTLLCAQNGVQCNKNQGIIARPLGMSPMQKSKRRAKMPVFFNPWLVSGGGSH